MPMSISPSAACATAAAVDCVAPPLSPGVDGTATAPATICGRSSASADKQQAVVLEDCCTASNAWARAVSAHR